jgi:protein TonB
MLQILFAFSMAALNPFAPIPDRAPALNLTYREAHPPTYPHEAVQKKHQGTAVMLVEVEGDGSVGNVKLEKSSGYSELDEAAMTAVRGWRYQGAIQNGIPAAGYARTPVTFRIH